MNILIILGVIAFLVIFFIATYKVVDTNEAHVVVFMGKGKRFYGTADAKSSYFFLPVLMKRYILPLTNVKIDISNIELNDSEVAPFISDVITWVRISDPVLASERLDLRVGAFESLNKDLQNIVQAIARTVSMKQEILEIMKDRKTFSQAVSLEVEPVLAEWGVELVNLEVNDIRDSRESHVISNYESIRKAQIKSTARIEIATRNKEAVVAEQENLQISQIATAVSAEASEKRFIEKETVVQIADKQRERDVAEQDGLANAQKVDAFRTRRVGEANVEREATVEVAIGQAEAIRVTGEKEADVISLKGKATGKAIEAKGLAEAISKDAMADAMKKFNNSATVIEQIQAWKEVQISKYESMAIALSEADLKLVSSGKGGNIFGFDLNAEVGADIGQMIEAGGLGDILDAVKDVVLPTEEEEV